MKIRGIEFDIKEVNVFTMRKWSEIQDYSEKSQNLRKEHAEADKPRKKEIEKELRQMGDDLIDVRLEIVESLLELNGLEYDKNFWMKKTSVNDIMVFITASIFVAVGADKKKVADELSGESLG